MSPRRVNVKYFLKESAAVELSTVIPVFHRWIQQHRFDELLIDVIDYKHVHEGPGIMLIGHEADYALDGDRGRFGLRYSRKRHTDPDLKTVLHNAFRQALLASALLEKDPTLNGSLRFRTDEVEVAFVDRLQVPNEPASLDLVRADLEAVVAGFYGDREVQIESIEADPRQPFTVVVRIPKAADLDVLVEPLQLERA